MQRLLKSIQPAPGLPQISNLLRSNLYSC